MLFKKRKLVKIGYSTIDLERIFCDSPNPCIGCRYDKYMKCCTTYVNNKLRLVDVCNFSVLPPLKLSRKIIYYRPREIKKTD